MFNKFSSDAGTLNYKQCDTVFVLCSIMTNPNTLLLTR